MIEGRSILFDDVISCSMNILDVNFYFYFLARDVFTQQQTFRVLKMGPLSIRHGTAQHVITRMENETRWVARVLSGTFLSHMAGRSLPFHSPVRFLFPFFSEPWKIRRPLQLRLTPTPTLHSRIGLHLISSGLHCTIICAVLTIDDLEGWEACRSCSWLLTGARQRLAVDVFPPGDSEV